MHRVFAVLVLVLCVAGAHALLSEAESKFEAFKQKFRPAGYASAEEERSRLAVFRHNLHTAIPLVNARNPHATFGVTAYADLTQDEFRALRKPRRDTSRSFLAEEFVPSIPRGGVPTKVDWVARGAVSPVQNEGQCGDVEVFTTIGNIEGANFAQRNLSKLVNLSYQEALVCSGIGCDGSSITYVYNWFLNATKGAVATFQSFPPSQSTCNMTNVTVGAQFSSVVKIPSNEQAMTEKVAFDGPINVGVDATAWQFYLGGVLTDCTGIGEVDQAALIVAYDDSHTPAYWTLKNSWGTIWGEDGYIRIAKGNNTCLVASMPITVAIGPMSPASTPTGQPSLRSGVVAGAIIGGAVGVLALSALIVVVIRRARVTGTKRDALQDAYAALTEQMVAPTA